MPYVIGRTFLCDDAVVTLERILSTMCDYNRGYVILTATYHKFSTSLFNNDWLNIESNV